MKRVMLYVSNTAWLAGTVLGVYALVSVYLLRSRLPSGICPITENKVLFYTAIALCCIALVLSFFEPKGGEFKKPEVIKKS